MGPGAKPRILMLSCNAVQWGGSEELWARASLRLVQSRADVRVAKPNVDRSIAPLRALIDIGVKIVDLQLLGFLPSKVASLLRHIFGPPRVAIQLLNLWFQIKRKRPDLAVLSQGGNWDGLNMGWLLRKLNVPYVLICQKASDFYWPHDYWQIRVSALAQDARHIFFVSKHNHRLFEEQIGAKLHNASVVRNPFLVDYGGPLPWPDEDGTMRFACVGRLYPMEKGQDMLLRVLARPKWRERDITINFYGAGPNAEGLKQMARYLGCDNARFHGHVDDVTAIWNSHHALVLPSRAEGLPLVLVEAMLAGRVTVVSKAGGSAEVVDDGVTGFLMAGQDEDGLDAAMERAWQARANWKVIGAAAALSIRQQVPADPPSELAQEILALAQKVMGKSDL